MRSLGHEVEEIYRNRQHLCVVQKPTLLCSAKTDTGKQGRCQFLHYTTGVLVDIQIHKIKVDSLFPTRFANTILSQLPRTCFAVLVMTERTWYALDFLNLVWLKWILKELPSGGEFSV